MSDRTSSDDNIPPLRSRKELRNNGTAAEAVLWKGRADEIPGGFENRILYQKIEAVLEKIREDVKNERLTTPAAPIT